MAKQMARKSHNIKSDRLRNLTVHTSTKPEEKVEKKRTKKQKQEPVITAEAVTEAAENKE